MPKNVLCRSLFVLAALSLLSPLATRLAARPDHDDASTTTPIKHVVVIFQENVSFDHYFGTYPFAANKPGEPAFHAKDDTPRADNLLTAGLLTNNPNGTNPFRIDRDIEVTCDQNHNYQDEQYVFHGGLMDRFTSNLPYKNPPTTPFSCNDVHLGPNSVMGYYDGNTVTALWNYAQYFAMSDNSFGTTFGPSTPGALNLIAGNTFPGALVPKRPNGTAASPSGNLANGQAPPNGTSATTGAVIGDPRPAYDDCVLTNPKLQTTNMISVVGNNVGDLLNAKGLTWGWFQGGFAPTGTGGRPSGGSVDEFGVTRPLAICGSHHAGLAGDDAVSTVGDYIPHHEPFEYYLQTSNIQHLPASSPAMIGFTDQAKHQYDLADFFTALKQHHLPAVSYVKASAYQDGHAAYSTPLDEQQFLVDTINAIMESEEWPETAIVIAYDDSDGWYDHVMGPVVNQSNVGDDEIVGPANCGTPKPVPGTAMVQNGRCGYGPRMPLLVISPWARKNYVDHRVTDQSSILRFIEDNWSLGRIGSGSTDAIAGTLNGMFDFDYKGHSRGGRRLILDPSSGQVLDEDAR
jgi:phospholipase C